MSSKPGVAQRKAERARAKRAREFNAIIKLFDALPTQGGDAVASDRAFLRGINGPHVRLSDGEIADAWKAGDLYKLLPTARRVADDCVNTLFRAGELATRFKDTTRILKNTGRHEKEDCRSVAQRAAAAAVSKFDGRGALVGFVSQRVWFGLSRYLKDPQSGNSAGVVGVPKDMKGREKVELHKPRNDRKGDPQAYVDGKQSSGTRADELEYARGSEFDNPAHIVDRLESVSLRAGLRISIDCVRDPVLKQLLRHLVRNRYDFRRPRLTARVLEEYRRSDAFLPRERPSRREMQAMLDRALATLRLYVDFEMRPNGGAVGGRDRGHSRSVVFGPGKTRKIFLDKLIRHLNALADGSIKPDRISRAEGNMPKQSGAKSR